MQRLPLLLEIWEEISRHTEIGESVASIASALAREMPLACMVVWEVDPTSHLPAPVAVAGPDGAMQPWDHLQATEDATQRLLQWLQRGEMVSGDAATLARACPELASAARGPCGFAGALQDAGETIGAAVFWYGPDGTPGQNAALAEAVMEPLAVAVQNDRRLRELQRLRQAAEVERLSLLRRIGRDDPQQELIVGSQRGLSRVMERVQLVSRSSIPVLILGETGSGKEVIARAIHTRSPRGSGPFVRVNCGAIPPELIDSELFGHEKGAFTGATSARQGWFERSDGGTLLLDEIGELPLAAQVRLLRVLQDGTFERVGGERTVHVDVRIIAATHRDLARMVQDGGFREDLWYRIAVFPIVLPPLRERRGDIARLAEHFARRAAQRLSLRYCAPTPADIERLEVYPWPGNVRELASVIDRAAILGDGQRLDVETALGVGGMVPSPAAATPAPGQATPTPPPPNPDLTLEQATALHIEAVLRATGGQVEGLDGAAARLDVHPSTLRSRLRKMGIDPRTFRHPGRGL